MKRKWTKSDTQGSYQQLRRLAGDPPKQRTINRREALERMVFNRDHVPRVPAAVLANRIVALGYDYDQGIISTATFLKAVKDIAGGV